MNNQDLRQEIEKYRDNPLTRDVYYLVMKQRGYGTLEKLRCSQYYAVWSDIRKMLRQPIGMLCSERLLWQAIYHLHRQQVDIFTVDDIIDAMKEVRPRGTAHTPIRRMIPIILKTMPFIEPLEGYSISDNGYWVTIHTYRYTGG